MKWQRREYEIATAAVNNGINYEPVTGHVFGCIGVRRYLGEWRIDHVPTGMGLNQYIHGATLRELKPIVEKVAAIPDWRLITRERMPKATRKRIGKQIREIMDVADD